MHDVTLFAGVALDSVDRFIFIRAPSRKYIHRAALLDRTALYETKHAAQRKCLLTYHAK
jgi:hypothetical protein